MTGPFRHQVKIRLLQHRRRRGPRRRLERIPTSGLEQDFEQVQIIPSCRNLELVAIIAWDLCTVTDEIRDEFKVANEDGVAESLPESLAIKPIVAEEILDERQYRGLSSDDRCSVRRSLLVIVPSPGRLEGAE